eukprot:5421068-Pyramimonas_sp.AAC.1
MGLENKAAAVGDQAQQSPVYGNGVPSGPSGAPFLSLTGASRISGGGLEAITGPITRSRFLGFAFRSLFCGAREGILRGPVGASEGASSVNIPTQEGQPLDKARRGPRNAFRDHRWGVNG